MRYVTLCYCRSILSILLASYSFLTTPTSKLNTATTRNLAETMNNQTHWSETNNTNPQQTTHSTNKPIHNNNHNLKNGGRTKIPLQKILQPPKPHQPKIGLSSRTRIPARSQSPARTGTATRRREGSRGIGKES